MELNYEKKYAYAELDCILKWLGESYINKIPKKVMQTIKAEKKFAYRPEIDFSKPLENQIKQETINMIAYLNLTYWLNDKNEKARIQAKIAENAKREKEKRRIERMKAIQMKANASSQTLSESLNKALQKNLNN